MTKNFFLQDYTYEYLLKKKAKTDLKTAKFPIKFLNFAQWLFGILTILFAITLIPCILLSTNYVNLRTFVVCGAILSAIFLVLFCASRFILCCSLNRGYKFRKKNLLSIVQGNLLYSYCDSCKSKDFTSYTFLIPLKEIDEIEYCQNTGLVTIKGSIRREVMYNDSKSEDECLSFDFFNAYNEDVVEFLKCCVDIHCKIITF
jgi:hypothetical protein